MVEISLRKVVRDNFCVGVAPLRHFVSSFPFCLEKSLIRRLYQRSRAIVFIWAIKGRH